ncbi:uncharacterized protein LOC132042636 isoform X2 [Lycium ferocissimum]|uniref:uncharacterized protein LOC132042636 isoform X2 n=1 Tax=Lycium ferocissimum TaxID=112874 RepID=UPI00281543AF|nr:uncharacterized protein LOC132042636 isoform X2 [Lycium ferocissimum]
MADMQKGFHAAVEELLPDAAHRRCARHIWSNWHQEWKGEERRKQFWRCSKASFEVKFRSELDKMSKLGKDICADLLHYPEKSWVRAYFKEHSKCDVVENNMCETFNSWILSCRHKSIITMLEEIRRKIMTRQCDMIKFANTWIAEISPMARLTLEDNKEMARGCKVLWNADVGFEIGEGEYRHTVNMSTKSCSCRTWQLRGIPCQHVVCAYYHIELEPEHFVEHWYRKDTFLKAYSHFIQPIPNMKMWLETNNPKIEPPAPKPMPGRPKKKRTKGKDEPKKMRYGKVSGKGGKITCSKCHQQGHNKKYCKVVPGAEAPSQSLQDPAEAPSQTAPTSLSQPTPSAAVCDDTTRVRRVNQSKRVRSSSQPAPPTDTSIPITRGITSQLPPRRRQVAGQKRAKVATGEEPASRGHKRAADVGFGIYTSTSGTQILNEHQAKGF